jgi:tight adherence protein C
MTQILTILTRLAPLLGALSASLAAYLLMRGLGLDLSGAPGRTARRIERFTGGETEPDALERLGQWALRRSRLDPRTWEVRLAWARLEGGYPRLTVSKLLGQALLLGLVGLLAALAFKGVIFWVLPVVLFAWPFVRLRSASTSVERRVDRALPETATLVAAEMAAGSAPDRALVRASELPGPMGVLLSRALTESRRSGRPLFSRSSGAKGALVEALSGMKSSELLAFATQLDLVAAKGAAGPDLMDSIARGLAREYRRRALKAAEELESQLVIPSALFFFLPFVIAVMVPLIVPLFAAF